MKNLLTQNTGTGAVGGESGFADAAAGGAFFVDVRGFAVGVRCAFIWRRR